MKEHLMITLPFTARTVDEGSLAVFTARSKRSPQARLDDGLVFLENRKQYRFLSLIDGWAHLDGEIGFIPVTYLDPTSFHIDSEALAAYITSIEVPAGSPTERLLSRYTVEMNIVSIADVSNVLTPTAVYNTIVNLPKHFYNEEALRTIVTTYHYLAGSVGIDWVMAISQAIHETDWFRSWWCRPKRYNFAGLGVTGQTSKTQPSGGSWVYHPLHKQWYKGMTFSDIEDGIKHHLALLLVYATTTFTDEQMNFVASSRFATSYQNHPYRGKAPRWVDLNGKWAVPGTTYAQSIARIANSFLSS